MTRSQLEHIIRAATTIADDVALVIVGSQSVLGQFPNAPEELLVARLDDIAIDASMREVVLGRIAIDFAAA